MGARGPLPKDAAERQRQNSGSEAPVIPPRTGGLAVIPDPPEGLLEMTRVRWFRYFESEVGQVLHETDLPALERLFAYYDDWEQTRREWRVWLDAGGERAVPGSTGQARMHPLAKELRDLEGVIEKLEAQLGVTPMARARLGITIGEQALTWEQVNAAAKKRKGGDGGASPGSGSGPIELS